MDFSVSIEFSAETQKLLGAIQGLTGAVTGFGQAHETAEEQLRKNMEEGEAAVRKLQGRLVELYALRGQGGQTDALKKEIDLTEKAVQGLQADLKKMGSALGEAGEKAESGSGGLASMAGAMTLGTMAAHLLERGIEMVKDGITHFIGEGIRFNVTLESARLGIGALIAAQTQLRDESGRLLQGQEALNASYQLADGVMTQLRSGSFQTIATLEELTAAYQQGIGPMLAAKVPLEDTTKLTVKFAQAAGALGLDINTLGHELRATFNGEISPRITKIATALQINNEDIQSWKEAGTLVENMNQKLEFFGLAGERVERSWRGAMSNLKHAMEAGAGEMVEPFQQKFQEAIVDSVSGAFDKNTAEFSTSLEGLVDLGKSVFQRLGEAAGNGVKTVMAWLEQISAWYEQNRTEVQGLMAVMGNVADFLTSTLGAAFSVVGTTVTALVNLLGSFPSVTTIVIFALGGLAAANLVTGLSFEGIAASATTASAAVVSFFVALGPLGWVIGALGALVGAFVALAGATERQRQAEQAHAEAMVKSNQEAGALNDRYQTLNASVKSGTLSLGERIKAEEEMRKILEKAQKAGDDYLKALDLEKMSLDQLAIALQKVTDKREADQQKQREQTKADLEGARKALIETRQRLSMLEKGIMPDTGKAMSADQAATAGMEWIPRAKDQLRENQAEVERLTKLVETYGDAEKGVALTLAQQVDMRNALLSEQKELLAQKDKLLAAPSSEGADAAFKRTQDRLKEIASQLEKIKATGITVESRPDKPQAHPDTKANEEMIRLKSEELRYAERITIEQRKQADLKKVDLDLEAERSRTQRETEDRDEQGKPKLSADRRKEILSKAEEVAQKAKAEIIAKYAEEERQFQDRHDLDMLQAEGRGLEAQVLQRRQAALAKVEEMRKHGVSETEIAAYQASIQAGINRDLTKASEDLQEKLTASQGRGWERRKALIEKEYAELREKLRQLNLAMIQAGTLDRGQVGTSGLTKSQDAGLTSGMDQALSTGRVDQVREDLGRLKQELSELAQVKGRALTMNEQVGVMDRFAKQSATSAEAVKKLKEELHLGETDGKGFFAGVMDYAARAQTTFGRWKEFAATVLQGLEGGFANFFTSLTQRGQTFSEKMKALWMNISQMVVQALAKIAAQQLINWGIEKAISAWQAIKSAWQTKDTVKTVTENTAKAASNTSTASTGFFASFAGTGPFGYALAVAAIIAMFALLGSIRGRKVGGLVGENGPELTMLGEEGLEVVAPEADFKDWAQTLLQVGSMRGNLQANLDRQESSTRLSQQIASEYVHQAQTQGERNRAQGRPFSGAGGEYHDYRGSTIITTDGRQWAEMVEQGRRTYAQDNG